MQEFDCTIAVADAPTPSPAVQSGPETPAAELAAPAAGPAAPAAGLVNLRAMEDLLDWQENQERERATLAPQQGLRVAAYSAAGIAGLLLLAWKLGGF
jgi:hypothetical protein